MDRLQYAHVTNGDQYQDTQCMQPALAARCDFKQASLGTWQPLQMERCTVATGFDRGALQRSGLHNNQQNSCAVAEMSDSCLVYHFLPVHVLGRHWDGQGNAGHEQHGTARLVGHGG